MIWCSVLYFCFKQKTAYEMRIIDWSSDVCFSDLFAWRACRSVGRRLILAALKSVAVPGCGQGVRQNSPMNAPRRAADRQSAKIATNSSTATSRPVTHTPSEEIGRAHV